jgi:hypothetical protein
MQQDRPTGSRAKLYCTAGDQQLVAGRLLTPLLSHCQVLVHVHSHVHSLATLLRLGRSFDCLEAFAWSAAAAAHVCRTHQVDGWYCGVVLLLVATLSVV